MRAGGEAPRPPKPLFAWHEAMTSIVVLDPTPGSDRGFTVQAEAVRAAGFTAFDADLRRSLPRFDPSPLAVPR